MMHQYRSKAWAVILIVLGITNLLFAADSPWKKASIITLPNSDSRRIKPSRAQYFELDVEKLKHEFSLAPAERSARLKTYGKVIEIPMPDGSFQSFAFCSYEMMEPELAAKWSFIKTYTGQGIDDPTATCKVDFTEFGFHYQVISTHGSYYADPVMKGNTRIYQIYKKSDLPSKTFKCETIADEHDLLDKSARPEQIQATGGTRREYRLALACTGEYAAFCGGTTTAVASAMVTSVNRVNGVYETEICVRLKLVANNNLLIFLNATSDPYTNNSGSTMLNQNQTKVTQVIGTANFDIGHVFSTGGGGVAIKGCVCNSSQKAMGVTGSDAPVGDAYDIDYVAHEMGHQFGGDHTFNSTTGSCGGGNRVANQAYEPGSGTTIMAYAGICGNDDIQPHSDPYFHFASYNQIIPFSTTAGGNTCAVQVNTGNNPPSIPAIAGGYVIPISTPFKLTAPQATDPDGDPVTYSWEQSDLGAAGAPGSPSGTAPIFRAFSPTTSGIRYFPKLSTILSNGSVLGERLPTYARNLTFKLVVRDNVAGSGGVNIGSMSMSVNAASGPFTVTLPNATGISWEGGSKRLVTWSVANTNVAPVNAALVNIKLSTDGGNTFPYTLKESVANDGSDSITLPILATSTARIMVEAATNVFFDVSNANFQITAPVNSNATINTTSASNTWCATQTVKVAFSPENVTFNAGNVFSLQLSNAAGQFTAPITIGTKAATGADTIVATIPANAAAGSNYKIRVVSSNPVKIGQASTVSYTLNPLPSAPANIVGASGFCAGAQNIAYQVAAQPGATGYLWTLPAGATILSNPDSNAILVNMGNSGGVVTAQVVNGCGPGQTTSLPVSILVVQPAQVTITSNPTGSICQGSNMSFTANPVNGGTNPSYVWLKNDTVIAGASQPTYATTTLKPGDKIKSVLISSNTCNTPNMDTSNVLTPTINLKKTPGALATSTALNSDTTCSGQSISFTTAVTNQGLQPAYQWFKNGVAITGANSVTYSYIPTNGDSIYMRLTSSATCLTSNIVFSNGFKMKVFELNVSAGSDTHFCAGPSVQLLGSPSGGTWSGTGVNSSGFFTATSPQTYSVQYQVTRYGCTRNDSRNVIVNPLPNFSLGSDTSLCQSAVPFALGSGTGISCLGTGVANGFFDPQIAGLGSFTIQCTQTTTEQCSKSDTLTITVIPSGSASYTVSGNDLTAVAPGATAYQWFLDNQPVSGATSATLTIAQSGNYCVEATFTNGCKVRSACQFQVFTGINGLQETIYLNVWPNPARSELVVDLGHAGLVEKVVIQNVLGQAVAEVLMNDGDTVYTLPVKQLADGVYTVSAYKRGLPTAVKRFVKAQ